MHAFRCLSVIVLLASHFVGAQHHWPAGGRILALAGAHSALPSEVWGVRANPASLAGLAAPEVAAFALPALYGLTELRSVAIAVGAPLGSFSLGACASRFGFALYRETTLSVGCGFRVAPIVAVGASVHVTSLAIARYGGRLLWTADLGLVATLDETLRLGASVRSLVGDVALMPGGDLPTTVSSALAVSPRQGALLILELEKEEGYRAAFKVGVEVEFLDACTVRAGAATHPQIFSGGCAFRLSGVECAYAAFLHQDLGWTHAFELRYKGGD